jgi:hypothetical protein
MWGNQQSSVVLPVCPQWANPPIPRAGGRRGGGAALGAKRETAAESPRRPVLVSLARLGGGALLGGCEHAIEVKDDLRGAIERLGRANADELDFVTRSMKNHGRRASR